MKKIIFALLFSIFMLSALTVPSLSQDVTVGVSVGDWFLYEDSLVDYEADEGVPFPPNDFTWFLQAYNETDWRRITVTAVSGTTITWENVWHYKNGTEVTTTTDVDITSSFSFGAIGANLEPGDEARPPFPLYGAPAMIINKTIDIEYDGLTRETNYCEWITENGGGFIHDLYWDKATGILVKHVNNASLVQPEGSATYLEVNELIDLSVWVIPEYPTGTIMLLVFVAVTVCVGIYRRKKLKHQIG